MAREDPYGAFNFLVEIEGVDVAGFTEVSGLESETDIIEYRTGDEVGTVRKLPGLSKYQNVTLKRGFTNSAALWEWRKTVIDGQTERKSVSIILLDHKREEVGRWNLFEAWPCRWIGPEFNAKTNEVAIESIEICHERIELG
jgi:phage tail-like protein